MLGTVNDPQHVVIHYTKEQIRLEFIKAAMAGYAANSAEWIKNASTPDTVKLAIQLADCTLAAAGEKGT